MYTFVFYGRKSSIRIYLQEIIMEKKYLYDAFISYRHTELDKFVAENLHKQMESFRLPRNVAKNGQTSRTRIERVFRDKDELPLTSNLEDPIIEALKKSEFLIVICTPRLKESLWCKKEIEAFISLHGRNKILAVLAEGEPQDSFPEELLYTEETVMNEDGTTQTVRRPVEPLAADVRGKTKKDVLKAMKSEILRLLAPIFSLSYDSLRQRHRERRMRKIMMALITGGVACLAFGIFSTIIAMQIKSQSNRIEEQSDKISIQNDEIIIQNDEIMKQNTTLLNNQALNLVELSIRQFEAADRIGAIQTAYRALSTHDGIKMPYTSQAQLALTTSLRVYDIGRRPKAQFQLKTDSVIESMDYTQDKNMLATLEKSGVLSIWNLESKKKIATLNISKSASEEGAYTFVGNDKIAYVSTAGTVSVYSLSEQSNIMDIVYDSITKVTSDVEGKYIAVYSYNEILLYDAHTFEKLNSFTTSNGETMNEYIKFDKNYFFYAESKSINDNIMDDESEIRIYNLNKGVEESRIRISGGTLKNIVVDNEKVYVLYGKFKENTISVDQYVASYRVANGEMIWSYKKEDFTAKHLLLPSAGGNNLLVSMGYQAVLLSTKDGTESITFPIGDEIINCFAYSDSNDYLIFTKQGKIFLIYSDELKIVEATDWFECKSDNVKDFAQVNIGYLLLDQYTNAITVYDMVKGPNVTESDVDSDIFQFEEEIIDDDAIEAAKEKNLKDALLADCLFYSDDGNYMFVGYANNNFEIYDTTTMELLNSFECLVGMYWYLGMDATRNHYIKGFDGGYILNSQMQPIAFVDDLYAYDSDTGKLLLEYMGEIYESPDYTLEELLEFAKEYNE